MGEEHKKATETGNGGSRRSLQHHLNRGGESGTERNARGGGLFESNQVKAVGREQSPVF